MSSCTESGGSRPSAVKSDGLSGAGGFDTSGAVPFPKNDPDYGAGAWRWPVLDPFTQGYIEALFASLVETTHTTGWAFRYLAPETLAAILKDCTAIRAASPAFEGGEVEFGRWAWRERQAGNWPLLPPLTAYLGDDGKVRLRPAECAA